MWILLSLFCVPLIVSGLSSPAGWHFVQNGTTGVVGLEAIIVSPTIAVLFDRPQGDPLTLNGESVWGAIWDLEHNVATPLSLVSDTFCASGALLSNGTMVSVGGTPSFPSSPATDGLMAIRIFEPCADARGVGCTVIEDPERLHLAEKRWYPSTLRIFDGSLMVVGGTHTPTFFYNIDPANNFEFFPPKDGGVPRPSAFLERSLTANLFPRVFALPDGKVLMIANNQTIIYDIEKNTETRLPDIPNSVRVTNPFDGTATLLPLSPPHYTPEILVCGGTNTSDLIPPDQLSSQDPASDQCSRITVTPEGIRRGWIVERMPEPRMMPEMILLPDGKVLIINGGETGYAAISSVSDPVDGQSNADHPVLKPVLYDPSAPIGRRFSNKELPTTDIARMYHSSVSFTPQGNIFISGSNPNINIRNDTRIPSEFRAEYLNPPYMSVSRPILRNFPKKISFNHVFTVPVDIPAGLKVDRVQVALVDLGFSTHAFHSSARLVFMRATISANRKSLTIASPPNNRVYPPGPAYVFLTVDGVTSVGAHVMVGDGKAPPVKDQGVRLPGF